MCLIIYKPAGIKIPPEQVETALTSNPDGFGMMWINAKGKAEYWKVYDKNRKDEILKRVAEITPFEAGVHFRLRTHGEISTDQSHPHEVLNQKEHGRILWLMHNGVFHTVPETDKRKSDTWHFIEFLLKPILLYHKNLLSENPKVLDDITSPNKLLLLDISQHKFIIINAHLWHIEGGLKYSNSHSHHKSRVWYSYGDNSSPTPYFLEGESTTYATPQEESLHKTSPLKNKAVIIPPKVGVTLNSKVKSTPIAHWEFGTPWMHTAEELEAFICSDWARFGRWLNTIWRVAKSFPGKPHYITHTHKLQPIIERAFAKISGHSPTIQQVYAQTWASVLDLYPYKLGQPHIFALRPSSEFPGPWVEERNHNIQGLGPIWLANNHKTLIALFVKGTVYRKMLSQINFDALKKAPTSLNKVKVVEDQTPQKAETSTQDTTIPVTLDLNALTP